MNRERERAALLPPKKLISSFILKPRAPALRQIHSTMTQNYSNLESNSNYYFILLVDKFTDGVTQIWIHSRSSFEI